MPDTSEKAYPVVIPFSDEGTAIVRHYRDGGVRRAIWNAQGLQSLEADTSGALQRAATALRRDGCTRALLTLITCPWSDLLCKVKLLRETLEAEPTLRRAFPGFQIEGPFLSDQPGFCGAHNPQWMCDPTVEHIQQLKAVVGDDSLLITLAPERKNSTEATAEVTRCGFVASFGHTNASVSHLKKAAKAGGRAFTHLGNGCPQTLDRHNNILWRILDGEAITAGLVPDSHHVSPSLFRALHRALGPLRIYWTTDAMAAAGAPDGDYTLGKISVHVGPDRVVRNPATNTFAGSALEPIKGIRRGARMLGLSWREVWDFLSLHASRVMNLPGELAPGSPAGFCLLQDR